MKTGTELIAEERRKQIDKHGFSGEHHANHPEWYNQFQLIEAARYLSNPHVSPNTWYPLNWDMYWFYDLCQRKHQERLKIAGALIAAEIDRLQTLTQS